MEVHKDNKYHLTKQFSLMVASAYLFVTIFLFIFPVFFNRNGKMEYPRYIPENKTIGHDFEIDYKFAQRYLVEHKSAYISDDPEHWYAGNPYPPIFTLYLAPLFWFHIPQITGYYILAGLILLSYLIGTIVLPLIYQSDHSLSAGALFVAITGITSYGMQFALERGQFDLLAMAFSTTAVYLFWFKPKARWLSYVLLLIAFEFKIYPILFSILFIDDLKRPKKSLIRVGGLCLIAFASLFAMGIQGFNEFLRSLTSQGGLLYARDHGFLNGVSFFLEAINLPHTYRVTWIVSFFLGVIGLFSLFLIMKDYINQRKIITFFPPLFLWCTLAVMIFFPASKDYKLAILCFAMAPYLIYLENRITQIGRSNIYISVLIFFLVVAYSSTLYSWVYRPVVIQNSFIMLYSIVLILPAIEILLNKNTHEVSYPPIQQL